jgi:hypothetical protein
MRQRNLSVNEAFQDLKDKMNLPFAMEIIILASWALWMTRNNKIFKKPEIKLSRLESYLHGRAEIAVF